MSVVISKILKDRRVKSVSDERNNGDGFWVYLKWGVINSEMECGIIHELSPSKCLKILHSKTIVDHE